MPSGARPSWPLGCRGGRAPIGAVYAYGYTPYNRQNALGNCGIGIATRVGGMSSRDVLSLDVNWMDFTRSYLETMGCARRRHPLVRANCRGGGLRPRRQGGEDEAGAREPDGFAPG
jgi:hypothetical protein